MFWARLPPRFEAAVVDVGSSRTEFRLEAIRALARTPSARRDAAVAAVSRCVDDPVPRVRAAAAEALSDLGGEDAEQALLRLVEDRHPAVREAAAIGLSAPAAGAAALLDSPHPEVRFHAALGLVRAGQAATEPLVVLLDDPDDRVREAAVDALDELGALGEGPVRDAIARLLDTGSGPLTDAAAIALARTGDLRGRATLARGLRARPSVSAAAAARSIPLDGPLRASLVHVARVSRNRLVRFTALATLAHHGDEAAVARLGRALGSWFPSRRLDALHVVAEARVGAVLPQLVEAARTGGRFDDEALAHALERFEADPRAHEGLAALDARR